MKKIIPCALMAGLLSSAGVWAQTASDSPFFNADYAAHAVSVGGNSPSANLGQLASFLATQLSTNRNIKNLGDSRIAIASLVDLDTLSQTSSLSMLLAENLVHEMHVRGFAVVDYKIRDGLKITQQGDLVFSRNIADLKREQNIHYFLSGTIALNADGAVINIRMIDTESSLVKSSAQGFISKRELHRLLNGEKVLVEKPTIPAVQPAKVSLK